MILHEHCPAQEKRVLHLLPSGSHLSCLLTAVWERGELCRDSRSPPWGTGMCRYWFHHDLDPDLEISKFPMMEPGSGTQPSARWAAGRVQAHLLWPSGCFPSEMQKTELSPQKLFHFDESAKVLAGFVTCLQVNTC